MKIKTKFSNQLNKLFHLTTGNAKCNFNEREISGNANEKRMRMVTKKKKLEKHRKQRFKLLVNYFQIITRTHNGAMTIFKPKRF